MENAAIPLFKVHMSDAAITEAAKTLASGFVTQGPKVDLFEKDLCNYLNCTNLLTTNTGTSAIHLAIHLLKTPNLNTGWPGINLDDEILTTPLTCTASNFPILANNIKLKWVDIDPTTLNMDLIDLERKITNKTKAIIAVHWGGYPLDLNALKQIQKRCKEKYGYAPVIIEDGAHSFGTKYNDQFLGNHGNMVMYSFQAIKHLTSVDGGALIVPENDLYKRAKLLRWYGIDRTTNRKDFRCEDDIPEWGYKFHMNDVNASIGIENLKVIDSVITKHQSNGKYYDINLQNVNGITPLTRHHGHESAFWIYSMLVEDRENFMKHMKSCGIIVSQVHERNDKHTCLKEYKTFLPTLDSIIGKVVSIPVGWWVTEEDRSYIIECIKKGW